MATADPIGRYEGHYLLVLTTKNEKVFHYIFKQLVKKEKNKLWSLLMQKTMWAENGLKKIRQIKGR